MVTKQPQPIIEKVTFLASLASNPRAIERIIDEIRAVTSELKPGQPLSASNEAVLSRVEAELEDYLMRRDPARRLSKRAIARQLQEHFAPPRPRGRQAQWLRALPGSFYFLAAGIIITVAAVVALVA